MAKTGRPTSYTKEIGERICELLASGQSLRQVLLEPGMPSRSMVHRWADQYTDFRESLARARETSADWHADRGLAELLESKGQPKEAVAAAREIAKYHMGLAKVYDPRRYGDQARMEIEHSGNVGGMPPVVISISPATPLAPALSTALDVTPIKPALAAEKE